MKEEGLEGNVIVQEQGLNLSNGTGAARKFEEEKRRWGWGKIWFVPGWLVCVVFKMVARWSQKWKDRGLGLESENENDQFHFLSSLTTSLNTFLYVVHD
jgi:hypothetical protein